MGRRSAVTLVAAGRAPSRLLAMLSIAVTCGCAADRGTVPATPAERSAAPAARSDSGVPAAVVGQARIGRDRLFAALAEADGRAVLEDVALDLALEREVAAAGLSLGAGAARAEEDLLLAATVDRAKVSRDDAARALAQLRRARGLGPVRYAALLERNARLRALVRHEGANADAQDIALAQRQEFGERVRARLVVRPDELAAGRTRAALAADIAATPPLAGAAVAQRAIDESVHPTSARGGLLDPLSPLDPAVPAGVRRALEDTPIGSLSAVFAMESEGGGGEDGRGGGFGVLFVESRTPAREPSPDELAAVERMARARAERRAMDRLARDLLARAGVTVLDESLRWSWEGR